MDSNKKTARIAGVWYLVFLLTFFYSLGYVPSRFLIAGDAAATIKAIQDGEFLFRLGIVGGMVACVVYLILLSALYKLLSPVGRNAAVMMCAFGVVHLPLFFTGHLDQLNLLALLDEQRYSIASGTGQLHTQVLLLVDSYWHSVYINMLFMGVWLLPFGYLVFKSGFLPKAIGVWLLLNAIPYLVPFVRLILYPTSSFPAMTSYFFQAMLFGEFSICLWLLIMGAKEPKIAVSAQAG